MRSSIFFDCICTCTQLGYHALLVLPSISKNAQKSPTSSTRVDLSRLGVTHRAGVESSRVERLPESTYRVVTRLLESRQH
jgi:hypothetical protein